jgi:hypothetical protein
MPGNSKVRTRPKDNLKPALAAGNSAAALAWSAAAAARSAGAVEVASWLEALSRGDRASSGGGTDRTHGRRNRRK